MFGFLNALNILNFTMHPGIFHTLYLISELVESVYFFSRLYVCDQKYVCVLIYVYICICINNVNNYDQCILYDNQYI